MKYHLVNIKRKMIGQNKPDFIQNDSQLFGIWHVDDIISTRKPYISLSCHKMEHLNDLTRDRVITQELFRDSNFSL